MRIKKLIIKNFRIFKEKTVIEFDNLTAFIGKNDIGKSTILDALDIFFNGKDAQVKLERDDINKGAESNEILIGVVFEDFPQRLIVDASVSTNLRDEFLLNRDGLLEIHKIYPDGNIKKEQVYIIANHPTHESLKDLLTLKISELKQRAQELDVDLSDEDKRIASRIREAIRNKFRDEDIELEETKIPLNKKGAKQIWEYLKSYLPLYALFKADRPNVDQDSEVQDPMKIAIKKMLREEEIQNRLKEVHEKVKTAITEIANETINKLQEMNPEIAQELKPIIPEPKWENVFKGITISSDEGIPLNKRGSGVRRLILLNFFRAEAEKKKEERDVPNIIYAFEEPETSQHPDHQHKLIDAFLSLSKREDTQIILTTHSPGIAKLLPIENLRFLYKQNDKVVVEYGSDDILEKIAESLGVLPSVDKDKIDKLKLIVCVEGPTDVEFFKRLSRIIDDDLIIDFENDPRIIIIPLGGSTLKYWVDNHYLRKLGLPEIHIYDGDKEENERKAEQINNRSDESKGFVTKKREIENYVHPSIMKDIFYLSKQELTDLIDMSKTDWVEYWDTIDIPKKLMEIYKNKGWSIKENKIKEKICTEGIERMSIELLRELDAYEEVKEWFTTIKNMLN
ncbi:ATP-binding protein [Desulfurobacterium sp.]